VILRERLGVLMLAYAAASLLHHVHNAEFLADYPNMPRWLTPAVVYAAWLATTSLGLAGYVFLRKGNELTGLGLVALYGAAGLYGLAHYALAPAAAHGFFSNLSIWLEAATGFLLLAATVILMARRSLK
jgi:hypothetical protein